MLGAPFSLVDFSSVTSASYGSINVPGVSITGGALQYLGATDNYQDNANASFATRFVFDNSVRAAGLYVDLNPGTVGTGLNIHVLFEDLSQTQVIPIRNNTGSPNSFTQGFNGFVGFVADRPVSEIRIYEGPQTNLGSAELYHGDNLVFANTIAPTPSALLAGFAGAGLLAMRRRRRA